MTTRFSRYAEGALLASSQKKQSVASSRFGGAIAFVMYGMRHGAQSWSGISAQTIPERSRDGLPESLTWAGRP